MIGALLVGIVFGILLAETFAVIQRRTRNLAPRAPLAEAVNTKRRDLLLKEANHHETEAHREALLGYPGLARSSRRRADTARAQAAKIQVPENDPATERGPDGRVSLVHGS